MITNKFEIFDIHLHAWPEKFSDMFYLHKLSVLDQKVMDDSLA